MNATLSNLTPLPSALQTSPASKQARRRLIGDYAIDRKGLDRFNAVLARLEHAPLSCDQLASAARQLLNHPTVGRQPECIEQRLRRATAIGLLVVDKGWEPADDAVVPARLVVEYIRDNHDLIPDGMPQVGRLDDAIVVDAAWPRLAEEVGRYLDYCRIRGVECELRGCDASEFTFGRDDWEQARRAELAWIAHCRAVSERSYVPAGTPYFRIR